MLQAANQSGSNEIVFTVKVQGDPSNQSTLNAIGQQVASTYANINRGGIGVGGVGGAGGIGGSGGGRVGGIGSGPGGSPVGGGSPISAIQGLQDLKRIRDEYQQNLDNVRSGWAQVGAPQQSTFGRVAGNIMASADARAAAVEANAEGWRRRQAYEQQARLNAGYARTEEIRRSERLGVFNRDRDAAFREEADELYSSSVNRRGRRTVSAIRTSERRAAFNRDRDLEFESEADEIARQGISSQNSRNVKAIRRSERLALFNRNRSESWQQLGSDAHESWSSTRGSQFGGNGGFDDAKISGAATSIRQAASGAMELARGLMYAGAVGSESLEKVARTLVKVEAGMSVVRGAASLGQGIGGIAKAGGIGNMMAAMGAGGPIGIAAGLATTAIAGVAYFGESGVNQLRERQARQAQQEAEARSEAAELARMRLDTMDGNQEYRAREQTMLRDPVSRRFDASVSESVMRGDRSALVGHLNTAIDNSRTTGNGAFGRSRDEMAQELERAKRITEEIYQIDQRNIRDKIEGNRLVTDELRNQKRIEESDLRSAQGRQASGAGAWFMASPQTRALADKAIMDDEAGRPVSRQGITALSSLDPFKASQIAQKQGAPGFAKSPVGQGVQREIGVIQGRLGMLDDNLRDAANEGAGIEQEAEKIKSTFISNFSKLVRDMNEILTKADAQRVRDADEARELRRIIADANR